MKATDLVGRRCVVPQGTLLRPAPGGQVNITRPLAAEAEGTITTYGHIGGGEPVGEVGIAGVPGLGRQVVFADLADVVIAERVI